MYSLDDFRRNFWHALGIAIGLTAVLSFLILKLEGWTVRQVFRNSPYEIWGFLIGIPAFLTVSVLAWQSAISIKHRGWKRILLLVSGTGFIVPFLFEANSRNFAMQGIVEGLVGGVFVSTMIVATTQIIFATYSWIKSGFDEVRDSGGPPER